MEDLNYAISTKPGYVKHELKNSSGLWLYCSPKDLILSPPFLFPALSPDGHASNAASGAPNSIRTIPDGSLGWEVIGTITADGAPPASRTDASRIEIRLFRETRSVLEYLHQNPPAVRKRRTPQTEDSLTVSRG